MGRLGDSIAILDGFESSTIDVSPDDADGRIGQVRAGIQGFHAYDPSPDAADGRIGQTRAFPNQYAPEIMPDVTRRMNVLDASGGGNYSGGSSFAPGLPLMPSTVGLASFADGYGRAGMGDGYGRAGMGFADGYGRAGMGACGCAADSDLAAAFDAYDNSPDAADGRIGQTRAFPNQYAPEIMPDVTRRTNVLDASGGGNYSGGSSFAPGLPLMPSTVGLADFHDQALVDYMNAASPGPRAPIPNVTRRVNVIDPSGGQNYSGGSSFTPGMPLLVSSAGLAELGRLDALDAVGKDRFVGKLTADGRALFEKLAGKAVLTSLKTQANLAKASRNTAQLAAVGRQMAIARQLRRALFRYPLTQGVMNAQALSNLAKQIAVRVANAKPVAVAA